MLQCLQTAVLQFWDRVLSLCLRIVVLDELSLVLFQETETPDYDQVDDGEGAKLLDLVNQPRVDEGDEDEEGVSREGHDQGQVQRVEENEDEEEREEDLISQQQAPLLGIVFVDLPLVKMCAHQVPNDLDRVREDHGDNSDFKSEQ